jgi:hypothetical protein
MTFGCQEESPQEVSKSEVETTAPAAEQETATTTTETDKKEVTETGTVEQAPPSPPLFEDFQGTPQLSLFPRVGDFRPEEKSERLPYWNTFIDHLVKVTGVAEEQTTGSRGWVFRSIKSIDSVGFFSPLGVEPQTTYRVNFTLATEMEEGASAGIGILEFNKFLWIPGQYTEETFKQHYRGSHEGKSQTGTSKGEHSFTFTTSPETKMVHIVLFREGTHDRNSVMFDDIRIEEANE